MDDGDATGGGDVTRSEGLLLDAPLCIFNAWSDEPWINEGAAVRVSLVAFCRSTDIQNKVLDGRPVADIYPDLTPGSGLNDGDLTTARRLSENADVCFMGASKKGPFDIPGELARSWLRQPNPHGQSNAGVLRPLWNGIDLTRRDRDRWIVDFGTAMPEHEAALFEAPFAYVLGQVKPISERNRDRVVAQYWWRLARPRLEMRAAQVGLPRYIATPHVSKHRLFVWLQASVLPDQMLLATARADDTTFGILHSRFHELWSLRMGTSLEDRPRYTPTTTFETFRCV